MNFKFLTGYYIMCSILPIPYGLVTHHHFLGSARLREYLQDPYKWFMVKSFKPLGFLNTFPSMNQHPAYHSQGFSWLSIVSWLKMAEVPHNTIFFPYTIPISFQFHVMDGRNCSLPRKALRSTSGSPRQKEANDTHRRPLGH